MLKLSIVIVTYNSAADLSTCLDSIHFNGTCEIIVVDNASRDRTREILLSRPAPSGSLLILLNPTNLGYARANNQGFALARGEYILLLNPDAQLTPGALERMVDYLDRHPDVAAVAPRLLNLDGTTQLSIRSLPTFTSVLLELTLLPRLFPSCGALGRWRLRNFDYDSPAVVEQPMASCLLLRSSVMSELGGFDENFPIYYNDVDLAARMLKKGYRTVYLPDARVFHRLGGSTNPLKPKMIYENHRALFRYLKKHTPQKKFRLQAVLLLPLLEISALIRVIFWRLTRPRHHPSDFSPIP